MSKHDHIVTLYDEHTGEHYPAIFIDNSLGSLIRQGASDGVERILAGSAWDGRTAPLYVAAAFALFLIIAAFNAIVG